MPAMKLKKGDLVQVISGKDRGKQGRIIESHPAERRVIVENLNLVKKHRKPRALRDSSRMGQQQVQPGGVFDVAAPIPISNVMVVCPTCNRRDARRLRVPRHEVGTHQGARVPAPGLRGGARPMTPATKSKSKPKKTDGYTPRLKQRYEDEFRAELKDELELSSLMMVPRVAKITLNMGVGDAKTNAKALDTAMDELAIISGQKAQLRRATKSIAGFKLREGMPIGAKVTLRGPRMYEFLDRLVSIALPRIRDFRGLSLKSFDGRGNYSLGIREQIIFPEIDYDDVDTVRGLDVAITTTARNDEEALALLRKMGLPFRAE